MAKRQETLHIFHLYRKDGTALFLHPFRNTERFLTLLEKSTILGHYGSEPRVESLTLFRNELYRLVESEVKRWVSDAKFIPRFILSAAIFLLSYLFLSFVVRDPVPILDEVAVSLGVSILAYILLGRRDMKSEVALKKRIALRSKIDTIAFTESEFVRRLETALTVGEEGNIDFLIEQVIAGNTALLAEGHEQEAEQIVRAQLPNAAVRRQLKMPGDEPCLVVVRRTWAHGRPVTFARLHHPGSRYELTGHYIPPGTMKSASHGVVQLEKLQR